MGDLRLTRRGIMNAAPQVIVSRLGVAEAAVEAYGDPDADFHAYRTYQGGTYSN